ncbi:MAG: hypothetical protein DLM50_03055 [Candidatus Meridianibacter frigidus]|nr:MAG: hypothetical protein DLM50_03055 [Candidatus Eremiobacteraeota bacterium]
MITNLLILLNVLAFLWELAVTGGGALSGQISSSSPIVNYILAPVDVKVNHEYYRMITCGFMHGSLIHVAVNMISLAALGRFIERTVGSTRMFLIYFISLIGASFGVVFFSQPLVPTLGASGAIFGLFGALFAIGFKYGPAGMKLIKANIGILVLNLIITFTLSFISKEAHIAGLIVGFIFTYATFFPPRPVRAYVVDANTGEQLESHIETR